MFTCNITYLTVVCIKKDYLKYVFQYLLQLIWAYIIANLGFSVVYFCAFSYTTVSVVVFLYWLKLYILVE